jgi:putative tricarboxylic transport membrane protein
MVGFGIFGYLMRKFGFEGAPFLMALIMGPMLETTLRQSLLFEDLLIFFKRPISAIIMTITFVLVILAFFPKIGHMKKSLESVD